MKYMGSKRYMLTNGLGKLLDEEAKSAKRIVDLFCGAGAVACHVARHTDLPVLAIDLQKYSVILTESIIGRNRVIEESELTENWLNRVDDLRRESKLWISAEKLSAKLDKRRMGQYVKDCRELCEERSTIGPIWNAYGGHYYSPQQALTFDYLLKYVPQELTHQKVSLAAVIMAASRCAASPGHTAQPFQPTRTAKKFLLESWQKDPVDVCKRTLSEVSKLHARTIGEARVANAIDEAKKLRPTDLVFVDPPYSGVQYSRFYHVLETIANKECGKVSGVGRYPDISKRPQSSFSNKGQSKQALIDLLSNLAESGATVIFTFPNEECSNGLSGEEVKNTAMQFFDIQEKEKVKMRFSTLGGNNTKRDSRKESCELILLMRPK
ncbi:MAG: DNA adenine methylase [Candidatus Omnitrophota bacterium]